MLIFVKKLSFCKMLTNARIGPVILCENIIQHNMSKHGRKTRAQVILIINQLSEDSSGD